MVVAGLAGEHYRAMDGPDGPDGPPIVIVHGAMDRAAGFRRTARHLPDRDIVAYDRRGYSGSRDLPLAERLSDHVDDLMRVCEELAAAGQRRLLVGHSAGGLIALHALARPGVAELVLGAVVWEPPLAWKDWYASRSNRLLDLAPETAAEQFLRAVVGDRLWERLPSAMRADRLAEGPALVSDMRNARDPSSDVDLALVHLPVVAGYGTESSEEHRRSAVEVADGIDGARLVAIEGAGHGIHLDRPRAFAELIASWG